MAEIRGQQRFSKNPLDTVMKIIFYDHWFQSCQFGEASGTSIKGSVGREDVEGETLSG